jgi:hypothetical protein
MRSKVYKNIQDFVKEKETEIKRESKNVRERSREGGIRKDIPGRLEM